MTTGTEPHQDLKIRFTATNSNGNFLDPTAGKSGAVRTSDNLDFTATGSAPNIMYQSTLTVPITDDPNSTSGSISVELQDDLGSDNYKKNYTIPESRVGISATINVIATPDVELSLNNTTSTTTDEGMTAMVTVSTGNNPLRPLTISYTPTNVTGNYLDITDGSSGNSRTTDPLIFTHNSTSNKYEAQISIDTNSDNADKEHGEILIVLDDPGANADYTIAASSNQNTLIVYDDETPTLKIEAPTPATVTAGNDIEFKLTSNLEPAQDIVVRFTPDNGTGNFLDTTGDLSDAGVIRESNPLNFEPEGSDFVATLKVPTVDDPNATTGTISVELQIDTTSVRKTPSTLPTL